MKGEKNILNVRKDPHNVPADPPTEEIGDILKDLLNKPNEPTETLRQYDKRELNKIIRNTIKSAEIVASSILSIPDINKMEEIARGYGVHIASPEEQLTSIKTIVEEYTRRYESIEALRQRLKESPDYYLESILTEWEFYQEVLKKS
ncbi:hypothetical protein [Thermococcus sp. GR4]|uniref:hypothetical protein n=1 Tax=Thermococcus sp. GR4 TaxID=1638254 RepID=UPI001430F396|nr:hypothetical protein [Thermococcus sp. GR4]NJE79420.1 hypothetical protein [Thermococcus sp. GR4]